MTNGAGGDGTRSSGSGGTSGAGRASDADGLSVVRDLWVRAVPRMLARLGELRASLDAEPPPAEAREEAHRLAGSLGTYGLAAGSVAARELELMLDPDAPPALDLDRARELVDHLADLVRAHRP